MTRKRLYEGILDNTITKLYSKGTFPNIRSILYRDVITGY